MVVAFGWNWGRLMGLVFRLNHFVSLYMGFSFFLFGFLHFFLSLFFSLCFPPFMAVMELVFIGGE